ncbi:MoaD/ThiS family protein [Bacillaceae bacterium IKA-2]|nr:MoaD/ThiS family protein [Bacillaceae bacterium IKA-2]
MVIKVISYIPYLENISNEYYLEQTITVEQFINSIGVKWDDDALVVVNRVIVSDNSMTLNDGDQLELLIPLSGG